MKAVAAQPTVSSFFQKGFAEKDLELKVKEGEIRLAAFVVEHNLSMRVMEHLPELLRAVCSDSTIAKKIKCGRTKVKSIITNVTGQNERERIICLMKSNKFSIIADESTDKSCTKVLCLVVRLKEGNDNIKDHLLALIPVEEATGAALFNHIITFFEKFQIPYKENCIGFASDGANNMMGANNSVVSRLREAIPNIFILKCICHSFALCASYACEKLPEFVEQFARDVCIWYPYK